MHIKDSATLYFYREFFYHIAIINTEEKEKVNEKKRKKERLLFKIVFPLWKFSLFRMSGISQFTVH